MIPHQIDHPIPGQTDQAFRAKLATPDGYCGDEDNGQTSAWHVFSAMGFYPVCPASGQYVIGAPLFKRLTISLENGKKIIINAPENSEKNRYVSRISYDGKLYDKNFFNHLHLLKGAVININIYHRNLTPNEEYFGLIFRILFQTKNKTESGFMTKILTDKFETYHR